MLKILDCTLRDGGYYTNWDFEDSIVEQYFNSMNDLPIDYLEIGYRSREMAGYLGKYFYCPEYELINIRIRSKKKLVIILNERDVKVTDLDVLLRPLKGIIDMIRLAIDPQNLKSALVLSEVIKKMGFEVGFNVMYMSKWKHYPDFISELRNVNGLADFFYMVDSYGGVFPNDIIDTINLIKNHTSIPLGFHGHNNLELALINSLTAIEYGVEMIDATILGMGRGAGNLKTELLLAVLNIRHKLDVNFNALGSVVSCFDKLLSKYQWGTNLPYMISGANSLPQKDVMDWVTTRFYSFNSIIQALQNQKNKVEDNLRLPIFAPQNTKSVLLIGGGISAKEHSKAITEFLNTNKDLLIVHASSKYAGYYKDCENDQIFCLVGSEGYRMEKIFHDLGDFKGVVVLPPYPRKMGTYIPLAVEQKAYELRSVDFTDKYKDSHTALALETAKSLNVDCIYVVGYDGYADSEITQKERDLTMENELLFRLFQESFKGKMVSLTPTKYKSLKTASIYAEL